MGCCCSSPSPSPSPSQSLTQAPNIDIDRKKELELLKSVRTADIAVRTFAGQTRLAKIIDVYDGDTVTAICRLDSVERFKKYKIRLSGVDAPEIRPLRSIENHDLHVAAAIQVKHDLSALIYDKVVEIDFEHEEKFGRNLGTIFTLLPDGTRDRNVNQWLLDTGRVLSYGGGTKHEFDADRLKAIINKSVVCSL